MPTNEIKRVFLYVGGGDYSALNFEEHFNSQTVYQEMVENGEKERVIENDDYYIEVTIKEFGATDDEFIEFIQSEIQDYDESKHSNFYEVTPD